MPGLPKPFICWLSLLFPAVMAGRTAQERACSRWNTPTHRGLFQDGDLVIGGLFNLYLAPSAMEQGFTRRPRYEPCTSLDLVTLKYMHAMLFAVEEINRSATLLPGLSLGYKVLDGCSQYPWDLQSALSLVGGDANRCVVDAPEADERPGAKRGGNPVPLLIGPASSTSTITLSRILEPLSVPVISFLASCPCLSDRLRYPNVFRTIPSDVYQARVIAQLVVRFRWTWVGAVIINNDYGRTAMKVFQEEIRGKGICLEFVETVRKKTIRSDARRAALAIQASTARVILIVCWYSYAKLIFRELAERNVTGRQFLASEAWSTSRDLLQDPATSRVASGVLGVAIRSSDIPGFGSYLRRLNPSHRPDDVFLRELWETAFGCAVNSPPAPSGHPTNASSLLREEESLRGASLPPCNGTESLEDVEHVFTDASQLREPNNVYLAVYAAAHALHSLLSCPDSQRHPGRSCSPATRIQPGQLLRHLNAVNVTTPRGESFRFRGADVPAKYDLVNWRTTPEGTRRLVVIGHVDGFDLHLDELDIEWSTGTNQVPASVCSPSCSPGTRMAGRKGEPVCCFDCIPCTEGEFSSEPGSLSCERCPPDFWSNAGRTACVPRQVDFLSFNETLGITLTSAAVSGVVVTAAVFAVFLHHRRTPMVRANNSELSFLLLVSLKLCFLCSLVFIGRPSSWSCRFQQAAFGISFVLCLSCLLVRTIVVLAAFRSSQPGSGRLIKWFGPVQQRGSVCAFTSVQVIICAVWLSLGPPLPRHDAGFQGSKITLECAAASMLGFSLVLGYIGLLACTSLLLAFLARKLPDNFNEAKLITFSMLIFCAVWVAFVPAYVSSPGKYVVAVEIFAILASSYGLLLCIFAPKCFIILLRPERNTKKHLMGRA